MVVRLQAIRCPVRGFLFPTAMDDAETSARHAAASKHNPDRMAEGIRNRWVGRNNRTATGHAAANTVVPVSSAAPGNPAGRASRVLRARIGYWRSGHHDRRQRRTGRRDCTERLRWERRQRVGDAGHDEAC